MIVHCRRLGMKEMNDEIYWTDQLYSTSTLANCLHGGPIDRRSLVTVYL